MNSKIETNAQFIANFEKEKRFQCTSELIDFAINSKTMFIKDAGDEHSPMSMILSQKYNEAQEPWVNGLVYRVLELNKDSILIEGAKNKNRLSALLSADTDFTSSYSKIFNQSEVEIDFSSSWKEIDFKKSVKRISSLMNSFNLKEIIELTELKNKGNWHQLIAENSEKTKRPRLFKNLISNGADVEKFHTNNILIFGRSYEIFRDYEPGKCGKFERIDLTMNAIGYAIGELSPEMLSTAISEGANLEGPAAIYSSRDFSPNSFIEIQLEGVRDYRKTIQGIGSATDATESLLIQMQDILKSAKAANQAHSILHEISNQKHSL